MRDKRPRSAMDSPAWRGPPGERGNRLAPKGLGMRLSGQMYFCLHLNGDHERCDFRECCFRLLLPSSVRGVFVYCLPSTPRSVLQFTDCTANLMCHGWGLFNCGSKNGVRGYLALGLASNCNSQVTAGPPPPRSSRTFNKAKLLHQNLARSIILVTEMRELMRSPNSPPGTDVRAHGRGRVDGRRRRSTVDSRQSPHPCSLGALVSS